MQSDLMTIKFSLSESADIINFCGVYDSNLRCLERYMGSKIFFNADNTLTIKGNFKDIRNTKKVMDRMLSLSNDNITITHNDIKIFSSQVLQHTNDTDFKSKALDVSKYSKVKARSLHQKEYIDNVLMYDIVFGIGPAGTGKTYLAAACALHELSLGNFQKIILTRPVIETDEHLGFLPGTLEEKLDPYIKPLYDAVSSMISMKEFEKMMADGRIELAPLAYMRGRTLSNAFVILDEAQNTTPNQMKMFLTRLGENSKMVVTGDVSQIDLKNCKSGLVDALEKLSNIDGISVYKFAEEDVVRHGLVRKIIQAYNN
ncbi:MAG: PhoH family protein [Brevinemataceae bacterium]